MGLIENTKQDFFRSLEKAIGEVPVLKAKVTAAHNVVYWIEDIDSVDFCGNDLNHAKAGNAEIAIIRLIDSLTNDENLTFKYINGNGQEIKFFWNGKDFERE